LRSEERHGQTDGALGRRRWLIFGILAVVIGAAIGLYLTLRPPPKPVAPAEAADVQSAVTQEGDSLQVIVRWELAPGAGQAESLRIEVRIDSASATAARVRGHAGGRRQDTVYVPAPRPGETAEGLSCVAAQYHSMISRERCTPWRFVRPLAQAPGARPAPQPKVTAAGQPTRIVVQPSGLQVDPDVDGRCAAWQTRHPTASAWIDVNRTAVPACTGPNNRPTIAQFCAFAELADGRRVKTANSANNPYCDELFRAWARERAS